MSVGLEEYTKDQWSTMSPARAGFRGTYGDGFDPTDPAHNSAKAMLADFYSSLNQQLVQLCRKHNISWTPFQQ